MEIINRDIYTQQEQTKRNDWESKFKRECVQLWKNYGKSSAESQSSKITNQSFAEISIRTLIYEMNWLKQQGRLVGSPEEEYQMFVREFLEDENYIHGLFEKYPVLYSTFCHRAENYKREGQSLEKRLERDRDQINQCFFPENCFVSASTISGVLSDFHHGNQSVSVLSLDNGCKIVYKPRSLDNELVFYDFLSYMAKQCGTDYKRPKILSGDGYGWMEFLEQQECKDYDEAAQYYYRTGILLFTAYLLSMSDLHYENIIACGSYPMLIDLETVMGPGRELQSDSGEELVRAEIRESVLSSGLLPLRVWGDPGVEISAMYAEGGVLTPVKMPVVADMGRSDMHITYRPPRTGEGKNLLRMNGQFQDPYRYRKEIQRGFWVAGCYAVRHREELWQRLKSFQNCMIRHVLKDTQVYLMYRLASYHPQFLRREGSRERFLQRLNEGKETSWEGEAEILDLVNGDIPYFYFRADSKSLFHAVKGEKENYFAISAMESVHRKLMKLSMARLDGQIRLILTSLECKSPENSGFQSVVPSVIGEDDRNKTEKKALLGKIMDFFAVTAVYGSRGESVSWFSVNHKVGSRSIQPMDHYLYRGLAGMLLLFGSCQAQTGVNAYPGLCQLLCSQMFRYTDRAAADERELQSHNTGAYGGESSILYVYLVLYQVTGNSVFREYAEKHAGIVERLLAQDQEFDLINGNAGAVIVLVDLYRITNKKQYLRLAVKGAEYLIEKAVVQENQVCWLPQSVSASLAGLSHGAAGFYLAFFRLYAETREQRYYDIAMKSFRYEESLFLEERKDWKDLRGDSGQEGIRISWCHGRGGILLARNNILPLLKKADGDKFRESIGKVKPALYAVEPDGRQCLCHGNAGNAVILQELEEQEKQEQDGERWRKMEGRALAAASQILSEQKQGKLIRLEELGMMDGLGGIAYYLLREAFDGIPNLLMLEVNGADGQKSAV